MRVGYGTVRALLRVVELYTARCTVIVRSLQRYCTLVAALLHARCRAAARPLQRYCIHVCSAAASLFAVSLQPCLQ
ncbi:hypothetical protein [Bacteroides ndongoniae]|uniref:hypothetical protein n=1 Tax=Bacteroides ndongoniae TaxID=1903262 RepID=UPI0023FA0AE2|nr:hypothetical protein [Bacteroides ndongoniae]